MAKVRARTGAPALLGGALLLPLLAGVAGRAAPPTLIQNCPSPAMTPGTYVLVRDLTCPSPVAITVTANNVNLVLAGHTLTASPGDRGVSAQGVTGLKIIGGTIVGFHD